LLCLRTHARAIDRPRNARASESWS
jgi:hypothetical protein